MNAETAKLRTTIEELRAGQGGVIEGLGAETAELRVVLTGLSSDKAKLQRRVDELEAERAHLAEGLSTATADLQVRDAKLETKVAQLEAEKQKWIEGLREARRVTADVESRHQVMSRHHA